MSENDEPNGPTGPTPGNDEEIGSGNAAEEGVTPGTPAEGAPTDDVPAEEPDES